MRMASYLQTNREIVFDHGIQEGEIHCQIRRQAFSQCGIVYSERGRYHRSEERDMMKRHLFLDIYVITDELNE